MAAVSQPAEAVPRCPRRRSPLAAPCEHGFNHSAPRGNRLDLRKPAARTGSRLEHPDLDRPLSRVELLVSDRNDARHRSIALADEHGLAASDHAEIPAEAC